MELNGALSNPFVSNKSLLRDMSDLHGRLLAVAASTPKLPRAAPPKPAPVLETVTIVLTRTGRSMPTHEIHGAAERAAGMALRRTSVKAALAAGVSAERPRFRWLRRGYYEIAKG